MSQPLSLRRQLAPSGALKTFYARVGFAFFLGSMSLVGAPFLGAQSSDSQQTPQDVAGAARQARARKQQAAGERHVYTNEDLHRSRILTPDDQARAAAAKEKQQLAPLAQPETQPLDANSATPQEPLGDVARRYRNARKVSPFRLPTNQPELASPKIVAPIPALKPVSPAQPQPPAKTFMVRKPTAPASRVASPNSPVFPSARLHRIDPFVGRRTEPVAPSDSYARPVGPVTGTPGPSVANPVRRALAIPRKPQVVVEPGDTLWSISRQHLGRGTRWLELMAANPHLPSPERLVPGTILSLPAKVTSSRSNHAAQKITVRTGDTLAKLALATYRHASYWPCIAHANPALLDPNRLTIGQTLTLPASCQP